MSTDAPSLPDDLTLCHEVIKTQAEALQKSQRRIEQLETYMDQLLRRMYGRRSEKFDPNQGLLFEELLEDPPKADDQQDSQDEPAAEEVGPKRAKRNGHGRNKLPEHLERRRIVHDVPEQEQTCGCCGKARPKIGEETSEQLEYQPASLFVIEHVRPKYGQCENGCDCQGPGVVTAEKPIQPIDKGLPGPGLLAFVTVSKYDDHLPLYRQEHSVLKREGIDISRSTMCGWMRACADLADPLYGLLCGEMLKSKVIGTDDTPVQVQVPGLGKTQTGRFWAYRGDAEHPHVVFDFTMNRKRDGPAKFLEGFEGYLQADAFSGYDGIYAGGDVVEVACWSHARRKFFDAMKTAAVLGPEALARIGQLYRIERGAKDLSPQERCALRQAESVPLLQSFHTWLEGRQREVLPKSAIGEAIGYTLNQWDALVVYTTDGDLSIDNNAVEQVLRAIALGRKNWLFAGSERGGRTAAVLFSLIASAKRHGLNTWRYLRDVLIRLADLKPGELEQLLPDRWQESPRT